jgi:hypothetical protein
LNSFPTIYQHNTTHHGHSRYDRDRPARQPDFCLWSPLSYELWSEHTCQQLAHLSSPAVSSPSDQTAPTSQGTSLCPCCAPPD